MSTLNVSNLKSKLASTPTKFYDKDDKEIGTLCRAWVNFNGTGTVAIRASFNVSSVTDNGAGDYTVNFTTAMPDANYSTTLGSKQNFDSNQSAYDLTLAYGGVYSSTQVRLAFGVYNAGQVYADASTVCVAVFR